MTRGTSSATVAPKDSKRHKHRHDNPNKLHAATHACQHGDERSGDPSFHAVPLTGPHGKPPAATGGDRVQTVSKSVLRGA